MPIRNTINSQGFVSTRLGSGNDELALGNIVQNEAPLFKVSSGSSNVSLSEPVTQLANGVTATLPPLSNAVLGKHYVIFLTSSIVNGSSMLSGTNLINGSGWTRNLSGSCNMVMVFAGKTPANTFSWFASSGSAL